MRSPRARDGRQVWWTYSTIHHPPYQQCTVTSTMPTSLQWPDTQTAVAPSRTWLDTPRPLPDSADTGMWPEIVATTLYQARLVVHTPQQNVSGYNTISGERRSAAATASVRSLHPCMLSIFVIIKLKYSRRRPICVLYTCMIHYLLQSLNDGYSLIFSNLSTSYFLRADNKPGCICNVSEVD